MIDLLNADPQVKKQFSTLKVLYTLSGICQGLSIGAIIPFIRGLLAKDGTQVALWLAVMAVLALGSMVSLYLGSMKGNHMAVWEVCDRQIHRIGASITKLPLGSFDAATKGKVAQVISTDTNTLSHLPSVVMPALYTIISSSIVICVLMVLISLPIAAVMAATGGILWLCWKRHMRLIEQSQVEKTKANQEMASKIVEFAQLQMVLRASGVLKKGWERLTHALFEDRRFTKALMDKESKGISRYILIANTGLFIVLMMAAAGTRAGTMDVSTLIGVAILVVRFTSPIASLLPYGGELNNAKVAMENINAIVLAKTLPESETPARIPKQNLDIRLENVGFSYVEGKEVLKGVTLHMQSGTKTALVGPSGSGKSTITRLIARFWDVQSGKVLVGGENVKNLSTEGLMEAVSMVFQEVYLFNTSIRENVAMAKPGATLQEIEDAAEKAGLQEVIRRLPDGWDTRVGEGGSALSGGEKQRVSIARAFLKNAPILLLDEITSALDAGNEAIITAALKELSRDRTVVVIAHRLSSIKDADRIVVIENGSIAEQGCHEDLLSRSGLYAKLWAAGSSGERWQIGN